jgi:hypothetical protein
MNGTIRLRGKMAGRDFTREIRVSLPGSQPANDVLATLWARRRVAGLMSQDFRGLQRGTPREDLKQQITRLGLDYRLMTQFTSFVAVEEKTVTEGGTPRHVEVPVEMPEGMSYEGVFGKDLQQIAMASPVQARTFIAGGMLAESRVKSQLPAAAPVSKLDTKVAAVIQRVKAGGRPGVDEAQFVFGGQAFVRVTLSDSSQGAIDQLTRAGLVVTRREGYVIVGRVAVAALEAISKLAVVTWIAPGR